MLAMTWMRQDKREKKILDGARSERRLIRSTADGLDELTCAHR